MEKVFDRVERGYHFNTLERFGFGQKLISWLKLLYMSPLASVPTNNSISAYFELQRDTWQGCPLSPLLFAVAMEPLAETESRYPGHSTGRIRTYGFALCR